MCSVISVTTPSPSSGIWSVSATSETRSRKSASPGVDDAGVDVGRVGGRTGDRVLGELAGDGDELAEVLQAGLVLRVVGLLQSL